MSELQVDWDAELHSLTLWFDAPSILTSSAVVAPVQDFAVVYRMATGVYGRPGRQRMDQPFPYARPHVHTLHFGSPLHFEVVVPTLLLGGIAGLGLPKLIPLVKQVIVEPGRTRRELAENTAARLKAREEIAERTLRLEDREATEHLVRAQRAAKLSEAKARDLAARASIVNTLKNLDPEQRTCVLNSYGPRGLAALEDVAKRAERGPTPARDMQLAPVDPSGEFPAPPRPEEIEPPVHQEEPPAA
jgi:hypothetical protein